MLLIATFPTARALVADLRAARPADAALTLSAAQTSDVAAAQLMSLEPAELTRLVATGQLAPEGPLSDAEVENLRAEFNQYRENLTEAKHVAEERYKLLKQEDRQRFAAFARIKRTLEGFISTAVSDASKAEVVALLARLDRIHYNEVAMLDRSAGNWEARAASEHERTMWVKGAHELLQRMEAEHRTKQENAEKLKKQGMVELWKEQRRLDSWLADLHTELASQAEAEVVEPCGNATSSPSAVTLEYAAAAERSKAKVLQEVADYSQTASTLTGWLGNASS